MAALKRHVCKNYKTNRVKISLELHKNINYKKIYMNICIKRKVYTEVLPCITQHVKNLEVQTCFYIQ